MCCMLYICFCPVALFARAWIEIAKNYTIDIGTKVALFARAWIEIQRYVII